MYIYVYIYIDTNKFHWCSIGSVAFHSFAWPQNVGQAKRIVPTLFANHCDWADVLIVRGRCFGDHRNCFRANRVLENLFWNWSKMRRPYTVYQDRNAETRAGLDPLPGLLRQDCVYDELCQCRLVGAGYEGWCHPGTLYSNIVGHWLRLFEGRSDCLGKVGDDEPWNYFNRNAKNREIAIQLSWAVMWVLRGAPPSVPPRGEPMVSVLTSRKQMFWQARKRREGITKRLEERMIRNHANYLERIRRAEEIDDEELSEEENIA